MTLHLGSGFLLAVVFAFAANLAQAENAGAVVPADLSSDQIVQQMQLHNQTQTDAIKQYRALRHYTVEYHGFSAKIAARLSLM